MHLGQQGCIGISVGSFRKQDLCEYYESIYSSSSCDCWPELNRQVTQEEYEEVIDYARFLGMSQVYIQEGECAKDSFIPAFDCEGI